MSQQQVTLSSSSSSAAIAASASPESESYLATLIAQRHALDPAVAPWLESLRQAASDRLRLCSLPTTRDEDWRFTNLTPLLDIAFSPANSAPVSNSDLQPFELVEAAGSRLTFVNGRYDAKQSDTSAVPDGVVVSCLSSLTPEQLERVKAHLSVDATGDADVFTLLNSACLDDIAVVIVDKNCIVDRPIHLLFVSIGGDRPSVSHPRCLVVTERSSAVTLVEHFVGVGDRPYFTNAVSEIVLGENAQVEHCKVQQETNSSFHIARTAIAQARDSRYTCNAISTGARLSRHTLTTTQHGLHTETTLNGLTVVGGSQLSDTHTAIDHAQPHGTSHQLHKCIVGDRAHSVFNGKVIVRKHSQLTDSTQSSRNLLLSSKARVDTKPQLEIFADDVKCAHGATVGQLNADEIFYLQSRGLDYEKAKQLLTYAFAVEIIDRMSVPSLAERLRQYVMMSTQSD